MLDARTKTLSVNFQYLNFIESTKQDKPTSVARVESFSLPTQIIEGFSFAICNSTQLSICALGLRTALIILSQMI